MEAEGGNKAVKRQELVTRKEMILNSEISRFWGGIKYQIYGVMLHVMNADELCNDYQLNNHSVVRSWVSFFFFDTDTKETIN